MAEDINFCTARKLASSVNIPFGLANSIVGYRKENGAILEFDELMNVCRITRNIMNRIKDKMELNKSSAYFLRMESVNNQKNKSKQKSDKKNKIFKSESKKIGGPNSSAKQTTPLLRFDQSGSSPMTPGPSPMLLYTPVKIQPSDSGNNLIAQYRVLSPEQPIKNHGSSALSSFSSTKANAPSINKINGGPKNVNRDGYISLSPNKRKSIKSWLQTVQRNSQNRLGQSKTTSPIKGILDRSGVIRGKEYHPHEPERSVTNEITSIKTATHNFCRPEHDSPRRITKAREMHIRRSVSRVVSDIADSEEDVPEARSDDDRNGSRNLSEVNIEVNPTQINVDISPQRRAKFTMSHQHPDRVNVDVHHYDRNSPVKASGSKPHGETNGSLADAYKTAIKMLRDCDDDQSIGSSVEREISKTTFTVDSSSDSSYSTDSSEASLLPRRPHKKRHEHGKKSKRQKVDLSSQHGILNRHKSRDREIRDNRLSREKENPVRNKTREKYISSRHKTKEKKRHKSREKDHLSRRKSHEREISKRNKSREKENHNRHKSQERDTRDRRKSHKRDTRNRRKSPEKDNKKRRKSREKSVSSRRMSRKKKSPSPRKSRKQDSRKSNKSRDDDGEIPHENDTRGDKSVVHDSEGHMSPDHELHNADNVLIEEVNEEDSQPSCSIL